MKGQPQPSITRPARKPVFGKPAARAAESMKARNKPSYNDSGSSRGYFSPFAFRQ